MPCSNRGWCACRAACPWSGPTRTPAAANGAVIGYTPSNPDGDDGGPITDYDVIGSAQSSTGIFALQAAPDINLLCIPPLTRDQDVGLSTLLVAGRFCRERRAMLIVDPPSAWASSAAALDGMRHWPFRSEDAAMFYPRIVAFDRLRGRFEMFAPCGVAAGMIARCDETWPVWAAAEGDDAILRPGLRPAWTVPIADRARLINAGINLLQSVRIAPKFAASPRTLASGSAAVSDWRYLSARRLALFVMTSIERGTRWMLFERNAEATWTLARAQVEAFLESLVRRRRLRGPLRRGELLRGLRRAHQQRRNPARRQGQPGVRFRGQQAGRIPRIPRHAQPAGLANATHHGEPLRQLFAQRR